MMKAETTLEAMIEKFAHYSPAKPLRLYEADSVLEYLQEYKILLEKVQELKAYLALPKFQGIETTKERCPKCNEYFNGAMERHWVNVKDVLNRL